MESQLELGRGRWRKVRVPSERRGTLCTEECDVMSKISTFLLGDRDLLERQAEVVEEAVAGLRGGGVRKWALRLYELAKFVAHKDSERTARRDGVALLWEISTLDKARVKIVSNQGNIVSQMARANRELRTTTLEMGGMCEAYNSLVKDGAALEVEKDKVLRDLMGPSTSASAPGVGSSGERLKSLCERQSAVTTKLRQLRIDGAVLVTREDALSEAQRGLVSRYESLMRERDELGEMCDLLLRGSKNLEVTTVRDRRNWLEQESGFLLGGKPMEGGVGLEGRADGVEPKSGRRSDAMFRDLRKLRRERIVLDDQD